MTDAVHLLARFRAVGVTVALNATGDGLKLRAATEPSADLLTQIRAAKTDLLGYLAAQQQKEARKTYPDWAAIGAQFGHCGGCAHWQPTPERGPLFGDCTAPINAFWPDAAPTEIHVGHHCVASTRHVYRRKVDSNQITM